MNDSSTNYTTIVSTQVIKALELTDDNELSPKQIVIKASANNGAFYAFQSLLQLLPAKKQSQSELIPCCHI